MLWTIKIYINTYVQIYHKQWNECFLLRQTTNPLSFQTGFPKQMDQHTGCKWQIHGNKHHKDWTICCKVWNFPVEYPGKESKYDIKESEPDIFQPCYHVVNPVTTIDSVTEGASIKCDGA